MDVQGCYGAHILCVLLRTDARAGLDRGGNASIGSLSVEQQNIILAELHTASDGRTQQAVAQRV